VGRAGRAWRWCRRNKAVAGLLAAVAAALLLGAGVAAVLAMQADQRAAEAVAARKDADAERDQAKAARKDADTERDQAKFQQRRAESALHAIQIEAALRAWKQNDVVTDAEPILAEVSGPFRQTWEQRYLIELCRRKVMPLRGHKLPVDSVALSADGTRIASGAAGKGRRPGEVKVWDAGTGKEILALPGYTGEARGVALSADGSRLVAPGARRGELALWDVKTGQSIRRFGGHNGRFGGHNGVVASVALSANGKRIASGNDDGTAKVWDTDTGRELFTFKCRRRVSGVALSADGRQLVTGSWDGTVKVWDTRTGAATYTLRRFAFLGPAHLVGQVLAAQEFAPGAGVAAPVVQVLNGAKVAEHRAFILFANPVAAVALSADGKTIVSAGLGDRTVEVWDAEAGRLKRKLTGNTGMVMCVAVSADGKFIASAGLGGVLEGEFWQEVKVWGAEAGKERFILRGHSRAFNSSVAISADGKRIVSGGSEPAGAEGEAGRRQQPKSVGVVRVWQTESVGPAVLQTRARGTLLWGVGVAFDPDGKCILLARTVPSGRPTDAPAEVKVLDARKGKPRLTLADTGGATCWAFSPDGKSVALGDKAGAVRAWDLRSGREIFTVAAHRAPVTSVAFSSDGACIASGSGEGNWQKAKQTWGEVTVWDVKTGRARRTFNGHPDPVTAVTFGPGGKRVLSASLDPLARKKAGKGFIVQPGGLGSSTVKLWDAETGQDLLTLRGHTAWVSSLAFSPDGKRIVTGSLDNTAKVWDTLTGQVKLTLQGHTGPLTSVAFSPDGTRVVSGSADGTVRLWDTETGVLKLTLKGHTAPVNGVGFSPDGTRIVSESNDGTVKIWEAPARP
jgi:WD40 repeat protein